MKRVGRSILLVLFSGMFLMMPVSATADTVSVNGAQVEIRATVEPMRYVVINAASEVLQIISNNNQPDIEPSVYLNEVKVGNEVPVTPQLIETTQVLLKGKVIKPGILYSRAPLIVLSSQPATAPLQVLSGRPLAKLHVISGTAILTY